MRKNEINAIDLDNTLIPYDSFRRYTVKLLFRRHILGLVSHIISRKLRLIRLYEFKKRVVNKARKLEDYDKFISDFSTKLYQDIDETVFKEVKQHSSINSINILSTASVVDYVAPLAEELGWDYIATDTDKDFHNYGINKIKALQQRYPEKKYRYNFAISDSSTDLPLLEKFDEYELIES